MVVSDPECNFLSIYIVVYLEFPRNKLFPVDFQASKTESVLRAAREYKRTSDLSSWSFFEITKLREGRGSLN